MPPIRFFSSRFSESSCFPSRCTVRPKDADVDWNRDDVLLKAKMSTSNSTSVSSPFISVHLHGPEMRAKRTSGATSESQVKMKT